ncbi:MAG TPA: LysR family transcriptional regulator [Steroidobacteraceae bacterium]|jgi:DNA-binding transcriptional LysR family regulator
MLDGVSLDHLRTFIAAADEGSFSAAGRRLGRAQSAVSQTLANLEGQLDVKLFDRSARFPVLTDQGRALLADARAVMGDVGIFKARAKTLAGGLEPELSIAVEVMFPLAPLTATVAAFQGKFPATSLRFDVESSAVVEPVLDGRCAIGVWGGMTGWAPARSQLTREPLLTVRTLFVVSPQHPLATHRAPIPPAILGEHIQLVHADIARLAPADRRGLLSPKVWRLSHLGAKLAFLRAGLGFGLMPLHMIEADLASGALVRIIAESSPFDGYAVAMSAIYRTDSPPGPAGRWFIENLKQEEARRLKLNAPIRRTARVRKGIAPRVRRH